MGTEYHWYILAHQNVTKLNADDYFTAMTGVKFKLAHKRANQEKWSATPRDQRRHLIKILQEMIRELEQQDDDKQFKPTDTKEANSTPKKPIAKKRKIAVAKI